MTSRNRLYELVKSIPAGKVCSYSDLGKALPSYASGLVIGRWMANCPPGLPWWRVVAKDGSLPIAKRNPTFALEQRERLIQEGVAFDGDCVQMNRFAYQPDLEDR